jgi:hypothetical protein
MQDLSKDKAISILMQALYEVKDAPISREEMIRTAERALERCTYIEDWPPMLEEKP